MAWTITIGGVDVTDSAHKSTRKIRQGSLNFSTELNARSSGSFSVLSEDGTYTPLSGQEVTAYYDGQRRFGGFVWSVRTRSYRGVSLLEHDVTLVDYNYICDCRRAGERSWKDAKVGEIVRDICNLDLTAEGIGFVFVADGPTLAGEWKIGGAPTVTDSLNALAKAGDMLWYVDANRELRMFATDTIGYTAAFDVTRANIEELTTYESLEEYANKVILKLAKFQRPSDTESYPGDGSARSFNVLFPIASEPIVKVNGSAKTVGVAGVDTGKDWYWSLESNTVTQDDGGTVLTSSDTIEITYVGVDQRNVQATADGTNGTTDELSARNALENRSGLHITTVDYSEFANQAKADEVAYQILATLSSLPVVVNYVTNSLLESNCDLIKPGDKQDILGTEYVVRSVKWQDVPKALGVIQAEVECVRGPLLKDFAALLKSLSGGDPLPMAAPATDPATGGGGVTTPDQPAAGDWSLLALEYSADAAGNQMVHLQANFTGAFPANADYLVFWLYQGPSRPSDPGKWVDQFHLAAPGTNGSWIPQPLAAEDWQVCVTACSAEYFATPDASTPLKTVSVAAWKKPVPLTGGSVSLQTIDFGGRTRYRIKVNFTRDANDKNFFVCRGDLNWCNSSYTPLGGDDGAFKNVVGSDTSPMYVGGNEGFDPPLPENGTQYRQLRLYPVGFDGKPNYTGAIIINLSWAPDGGFKASSLDASTLDSTMAIKTIGGVKKLAIADGAVTKQQVAASYDLPEIVSGIPTTLTGHSRLIYNTTDGNVYRWNSLHSAYEWAMDGDAVKAVLAYSKLTAAEFAASIEPVGLVSFIPSTKSTSTIYNIIDGKTYRWNGSAYVRDTNSTEIKTLLTADKLVAGQIAAGAIGTTQLSTAEILIGAGGGKCGRFRINDGFGAMIGFMGDDNAGFVGMWASRGKFGGTFASPVIDLSTGGATINNAAFSLNGSLFTVGIDSANGLLVTDTGSAAGSYLQAKSNVLNAVWPTYGIEASFSAAGMVGKQSAYSDSYAKIGPNIGATGGRVELKAPTAGTLVLEASSTSNSLVSSRYGSFIDFVAGGGYINIGEYRVANTVVIDASKNFRWANVITENLVLGGLTATKWVPCYNSAGVYQGKIPIIP